MFLGVKEMERRKILFEEVFPPGQIDFSDEGLVQASPLRVSGSAELLPNTEGQLRIQGSYSVEMTAQCDRCLGGARFPLEGKFDLFYQPTADVAAEDEVEIDADEVELGFYEGEGIELGDILLEQVLLALPMQRVCSSLCKGFCPVCGGNRNEVSCDCTAEKTDDRWGALRNLSPE